MEISNKEEKGMEMDGISESFRIGRDKSSLIDELKKGEKRIRQALFDMGYFAYKVGRYERNY